MMERMAVWKTLIKISLTLSLVMGLVLINGCGEKEEKQPSEKGGEKTMVKKQEV